MRFSTYIPISLMYKGQRFSNYLFYSALDVTSYKAELLDLIDEIIQFYNCADDLELQKQFITTIGDLLTRVTKFWLEKVMRPLSVTEEIPAMSRCYCYNKLAPFNTCLRDILTFSHYEESSTKIKVDIFNGPPCMSINVAAQDSTDVDKFRKYYSNLLAQNKLRPCCACCPISKDLIRDIEQQINVTVETLKDISTYKLPSVTV